MISATVSNISFHAFDKCKNLKSVTVKEDNKTFYAESNCIINKAKKSVVFGCNSGELPEGIRDIGQYAFAYRDELVKLVIPESLKKIGAYSFAGCKNLKTVIFPEGLESIGMHAFADCVNLEEIILPDSLKILEEGAFANCKNARILRLSQNLKVVPINSFMGCAELEYLDVPEGVERLENYSFCDCLKLRYVSLPSTLEDMFNAKIECNPYLERITVAAGNKKYSSEGNCLVQHSSVNYLILGCKNSVIPLQPEIQLIEGSAFKNCDIEQIEFPEGVWRIYSTFEGCNKLKRVRLPESLIQMWQAFKTCQSIEEVTAPERFRRHFENINPKIVFNPV